MLRDALERGPQAQADLGAWLSALPAHVALPSWIGRTVQEIGRRIVPKEVDSTHADARVLGNLDAPLVEQLPTGPIAEMRPTQLVFPGALATAAAAQAEGWSVGETELADGEDEEAIEELDDQVRARHAMVVPVPARARYRSWSRRWVRAVSAPRVLRDQSAPAQPAVHLRMTVLCLYLCLYLDLLAAGVWGTDETWREELADLVQSLAGDPADLADTPGEGPAHVGSLVAVCLAVLLQDGDLHGGTPVDVIAKRAWDRGGEYAALADEKIINGLLYSTQTDARVASLTEALRVVELAREARQDPYAEARAGFESDGHEVEFAGGAWIIRGDFRNTARLAVRAVTEFATQTGVATALASNGRKATLMLRRGSLLIMAESAVRRWRVYHISARSRRFRRSLRVTGSRLRRRRIA